MTDPDFFKNMGFFLETEPVQPDFLIEETPRIDLCGMPFRVLLVPGHCPGSLCFYSADDEILFDGDVLFAGSIGRTDFPGGDHQLLIRGIREKVLTLPDKTAVLPGHGPQTTIGDERRNNPFLAIDPQVKDPPINSKPTGFQFRSAPSDARSRRFYRFY